MKPVWVVQKNLTSEFHRWERALWENKSSFRHIEIIPFSDSLPDVDIDPGTPVIVYGSTTLIKNLHTKDWKPGAFFNPDNFRPSLWRIKYGRNFLNYDGCVHKMCELSIPGVSSKDGYAFVRPNGDFKDFSGSVVDYHGWEKFLKSVQEGGYTFDDQLDVYAAPCKNLFEEYRMFIVDGKVVSSSKYRLRTILDKKPGCPDDILSFAQEMADIWSPERAYVMDVCRTDQGSIHLLELNCFNASGVYAAPLLPIINAVEGLFK